MRHILFKPISARRGLGKPASRLTSLSESNSVGSLPEYRLLLWDPRHALPHFIAAVQPKLTYNKVIKITYSRGHKDACAQIPSGCCFTKT